VSSSARPPAGRPAADAPPAALREALAGARRIAVLTGAGMSAESGIPTFRGARNGLWARFDPQQLATAEAFEADPERVWAWYEWRRLLVAQALPNAGHRALAALAARLPSGGSLRIVTQNVDDLHERAGSQAVTHLHGSLFAPRCFDCGRPFDTPLSGQNAAAPREHLAPPRCPACGGAVRPGVVWFGVALPEGPWRQALEAVAQADLLLVVGTSGLVQPAASLPAVARRQGTPVAVINPEPMAGTAPGDLSWATTAAEGLPRLLA